MVFKKLELSGFKSFADKTTLVFEPGVTAIVGPNGSGKSNVADGIKWVLGEQSARELRGGHMEDLIFNGTDSRSPINVAEVSLTFDNASKLLPTDYSEVTITRRLYRSGESEYLLNKTQVRLKDINELLSGTGIGTSAYSLFEQGKIDQLIQSRPEERRSIFEEAAGITRYKTQKREALRKLEQTEDNLLRLNDVIVEVRRQLQAMERQVRKAQTYRDQWEKLKQIEWTLAQRDDYQIRLQENEKRAQNASIQAREQELQEKIGSGNRLLDEKRVQLDAVNQAYAQAKAEALRAAHAIEIAQQQIQSHRDRVEEGRRRKDQIQLEIETLKRQWGQAGIQIEELRQAISVVEPQRQACSTAFSGAQAAAAACDQTIQQTQELVRQRKEAVVETMSKTAMLRNALAQISAQLHTAQARAARLETELSRVAQERSVLQAQTQEIEQAFKAGRARDLELSRCLNDQKIAFEEARMRTEESDRGLREAQQILVVLQSRYEILQGLAASHEGYSAGVRHLLESLQQGTLDRAGVTGVLAHLIRVEPGYEMAVEAALGDLAQAVVVENWETAARCLDHLQAANAGRATFLVSSAAAAANGSRTMTLRPSTSGNQKNSAEGPHEPVASQVHVAAELESLVDSLLGHAYLARDLGTALELTQTAIVPLCFVTPQGERVEVPLVTGGGSLSTDNMLVGRRQRLAQVQADLENVRQRVASAENQETTARSAQDSLEAALDGLEKEVQDHRKILAQHETQHASLSAQLRQLTDENAVLESEFSLARQQHDQAREQESLAGRALAEAEEQSVQWQMQITQAQETLAQASREREVYVVQAAQVQAQLSTLDEVRSSREQSLKLMEQSLGSMQDSIRAREGEFEALVSREQELTDQRAQFEREIAARAQAQCTDEQTLEQVIGERNAMAQSISGEASGLHALETERDAVRLQKHEIELNLNQLSYQRQALADRLSQVYQLVLDPAAGFPQDPQDQDWEKLTADCDVLRKRMEGIGAVSMSSLDENQELQDRLQFLTQQQADLMKAKDDLHEAITKINRTTRAQFKETFQKIQQEFQTTFKTLFGGGEARLVLMDEEDILESGIEIIARPPGKTLQSISLLSGGEKALTSVALLFSIFRVKPSPFCLLDEIDAPLDEANVDRFTKALKEFLKDSQFIIITHNKKTIVMADVMYGITMEEHGVSKIVSVKFQDRSVSSQTAPAALSDLSQAAAAEPAAPPAP